MIKQDQHNYRKHNKKNKDLIKKSLSDYGAGRSILIDKNDEIIAGNGVFEQAEQLGLNVKVIETDGNELIAVKRIDLDTEDEKRKQLAVMDNSTSDSSDFDFEALSLDFNNETLKAMGVAIAQKDIEEFYTKNVNIPQYEITNENVTLKDCLDNEKTESLVKEIKESGVTEEEKAFLIAAAQRHLVFNYGSVAEYYAKANPEMQKLMEKSALVIIDFKDAIKYGYVKLKQNIQDLIDAEEDGTNEEADR